MMNGEHGCLLLQSHDPLAITYNDQSPLENHHLAAAFRLMQKPQYRFMEASACHARSWLPAAAPVRAASAASKGCIALIGQTADTCGTKFYTSQQSSGQTFAARYPPPMAPAQTVSQRSHWLAPFVSQYITPELTAAAWPPACCSSESTQPTSKQRACCLTTRLKLE